MDDVTLPQAAASNNPLQQIQQYLLNRVQQQPDPQVLAQQRQQSLEQYQNSLRQPPMGNYTGTEHGLYSWIRNMGRMSPFAAVTQGIASGGDWQKANQEGLVHGDQLAFKAGYDDVKDREKESDLLDKSMMTLGKASLGKASNPVVKMDKDGNMVVYDPVSGSSRVVHASQRGEYQRVWQKAYTAAVDEGMENPESYAHGVASRVLGQSPGFNPQVTPTGSEPKPGAMDPNRVQDFILKGENGVPSLNLKGVSYNQARDQLNSIQNVTEREAALKALEQAVGSAPQPNPASINYRDRREDKQIQGYGTKEGEGLFKERENLTGLLGANSKVLSQLNALEELYKNPGMPEGEAGPRIQQIRSFMKSFNIPVDESVGPADFANALATNMSLLQKNADGHNLLPGAMSNYEDQLLQKMAPTLSLTQPGRLALIQFMKEVANANIRIANEGTKAAEGNLKQKGMLPSEWYSTKEKVMLQEMLRLKKVSEYLANQNGVK